MFGMMHQRLFSLGRGETRFEQIAMREPNWPMRVSQLAQAFSNEFELSDIFYVLTILLVITHHADLIYWVLAWLFAVFRLLTPRTRHHQ
jgi:hypothetical protein